MTILEEKLETSQPFSIQQSKDRESSDYCIQLEFAFMSSLEPSYPLRKRRKAVRKLSSN
ncbi:MAG: hypothetical protein K0S07_1661 [Chlamydiales bacterium]|jgi:hypothetical protein|nr:hypothetical protein [Chlamydiales bacterium]